MAVSRFQDDFEGEALADAAVSETARLASMMFAGIGDALDRYVRTSTGWTSRPIETDHRAYVEALEASRSGIAPLLSDLSMATTFEDIDRSIGSSGLSDAQPRVVAACTTLQATFEALWTGGRPPMWSRRMRRERILGPRHGRRGAILRRSLVAVGAVVVRWMQLQPTT